MTGEGTCCSAAQQAHQQSLAVASSRHEADDQAFIDALADDE